MKLFRRMTALFLGCVLLAGTALAHAQGWDSLTSVYLDQESDVHFALSAQFEELVPYGEQTVEMFNSALRNVSVSSHIARDETTLEINVAGDPVIDLAEKIVANGTELTTGLLPKRVLTSTASAMDALSGNADEAQFDFLSAVDELEGCYQALTDAITPYAEEKKASYTIKDTFYPLSV